MHAPSTWHWPLAVLGCLIFAGSCSAPYRVYEGPGKPRREVAAVTIAGNSDLVRSLTHPSGGPDVICLLAIDGQRVGSTNRFDFLPGRYTLTLEAEGSGYELRGRFAAATDLVVDLKANKSYQIVPCYREGRQRALDGCPWRFCLTEAGGDSILAGSQAALLQLDVLDKPLDDWLMGRVGRRWDLVEWRRSSGRDVCAYVPGGEHHDRWTRRLRLTGERCSLPQTRESLEDIVTTRTVQPGGEWQVERVGEASWMSRWTRPGLLPEESHRGITYFEVKADRIYTVTYESHDRITAAAEYTAWEYRLASMGH